MRRPRHPAGWVDRVDLGRPRVEACHRLARVGRRTLWDEVGDALGTALAGQTVVPTPPAADEALTAAVRVPGVPWRALLAGSAAGQA